MERGVGYVVCVESLWSWRVSLRVNLSQLCRRFQISREVGYKWLKRYREEGLPGLADRSRRPEHSPGRTEAAVEQRVLSVRDRHSAWGARKIRRRLLDQGVSQIPAASTVHAILCRHGRIDPAESVQASAVAAI